MKLYFVFVNIRRLVPMEIVSRYARTFLLLQRYDEGLLGPFSLPREPPVAGMCKPVVR